VDESEIVFTYPYLIGFIMDEQKSNIKRLFLFCFIIYKIIFLDSRLVEINMIFHILKDRDLYREEILHGEGGTAANWASAVKKMRHNIVVCNYKFLRDMSNNAKDDSWIISGLNHWLPSEYEQEPQQPLPPPQK
jgi:hypothetical protein